MTPQSFWIDLKGHLLYLQTAQGFISRIFVGWYPTIFGENIQNFGVLITVKHIYQSNAYSTPTSETKLFSRLLTSPPRLQEISHPPGTVILKICFPPAESGRTMRNSYKIYYLITYLALRIDLIDLCVLLNGDSFQVVKGAQ